MKRALALAVLLVAAGFLLVPGTSLYFESAQGRRCTSCHEMQPLYDTWHTSSHRDAACGKCHGDTLTLDAAFHMNNVHRAWNHLRGDMPERVGFGNRYVMQMDQQCRSCHRQEYASWESGAHSASFARIFLDKKHNTANMLMDDCLRCHGMFYEGGIGDLVQPVNRNGPWQLTDADLSDMPSMPCATCHQVHRPGERMHKISPDGRRPGPAQEVARPSLAFFDRRTETYVPLADLPIPAMKEGSRAVRMSPDHRQALCYQCHAPVASMQVASGDDRTGIGVHEGISCLSCHEQHGQKTRTSCATCHPKMSNCGIDVERMDTTFRSPESKHNIHWVKCADCHPNGIPRKKTKENTL